jgi:hypothetical protein
MSLIPVVLLPSFLNAFKFSPQSNVGKFYTTLLSSSEKRYSNTKDDDRLSEALKEEVDKTTYYVAEADFANYSPVFKTTEDKDPSLMEIKSGPVKLDNVVPGLKLVKKERILRTLEPVNNKIMPVFERGSDTIVLKVQPHSMPILPLNTDLEKSWEFNRVSQNLSKKGTTRSTAVSAVKTAGSYAYAPAGVAIGVWDRGSAGVFMAKHHKKYPWLNLKNPVVSQYWAETLLLTGMTVEEDIAVALRWDDIAKYWESDLVDIRNQSTRYEYLQRAVLSLYYSGQEINDENMVKFFEEYDKKKAVYDRYDNIPLKPFQLIPKEVKTAMQHLGNVNFYSFGLVPTSPSTKVPVPWGTALGLADHMTAGRQGRFESLINVAIRNDLSIEELTEYLGYSYVNEV